jgi:transcriptional regulator with XRE-family HTH domain
MTETQPMTIGKRLRAARLERRLSQQELADKSGVSQQTIAKIENDKVRFSRHFLTLAKILAVPVRIFDPETAGEMSDAEIENAAQAMMRGNATWSKDRENIVVVEHDAVRMPVFALELRPDGQFWDNVKSAGSLASVQQLTAGPKTAALYVAEATHSPAVEPGDVIVINADLPPLPGSDCLFIGPTENAQPWKVAVRRLREIGTDYWVVEQFNPRESYRISRADFPTAQRIVAIYRRP